MSMSDSYELYEAYDGETSKANIPIRITKGKFKDFVYRYDTIKVGDFKEEDEDFPLTFNYVLLEAPDSYETENEDVDQKEFEQMIGDILYDIFVNSAQVQGR